MNLRNVYIGRYKNSNTETLFYQKNLMRYLNLKEGNKEVYEREINLNSLISLQDAIPTEKEKLKKTTIVKLYDDDRSRIISLNKLFIGDIYRVTDVLNREIKNDKNQGLLSGDCYTTFTGILIKQGALLINEEEFFKDMEHSIIVKRNYYPEEGELVVIENDQLRLIPSSKTKTEKLQPFTTIVLMNGNQASKRKILEEYRRYMP